MRRIDSESPLLIAVIVATTSALLAGSVDSSAQNTRSGLTRTPGPSFETSSLTLATLSLPPSNHFRDGHWQLAGVTLRGLVRAAYASEGVFVDNQVLGGPEWIDTERYDVHAVMPSSLVARPDAAALRLTMLQRLLADRFAIAVRLRSKELPVFDLVRVDDGPPGSGLVPISCRPQQMTDDVEHCPPTRVAAGAVAVSLSDVAAMLSTMPEIGRVVRDRTGLAGPSDVQLHWSGGSLAGSAADGLFRVKETLRPELSLESALRSQLGLIVVSARGHVNVVQIERAERPWLDDPFAPHHSHH